MMHPISEYSELKEEDIQEIDRKIKEAIYGKTLFEEFIEKLEWNQKAVAMHNPYSLDQIFQWPTPILTNVAFTKITAATGRASHEVKRHG